MVLLLDCVLRSKPFNVNKLNFCCFSQESIENIRYFLAITFDYLYINSFFSVTDFVSKNIVHNKTIQKNIME